MTGDAIEMAIAALLNTHERWALETRMSDPEISAVVKAIYALRTLQSSGYVVVPIKPTQAMIDAGNDWGDWGCKEESSWTRQECNPAEIYTAMIGAASPKPQEKE